MEDLQQKVDLYHQAFSNDNELSTSHKDLLATLMLNRYIDRHPKFTHNHHPKIQIFMDSFMVFQKRIYTSIWNNNFVNIFSGWQSEIIHTIKHIFSKKLDQAVHQLLMNSLLTPKEFEKELNTQYLPNEIELNEIAKAIHYALRKKASKNTPLSSDSITVSVKNVIKQHLSQKSMLAALDKALEACKEKLSVHSNSAPVNFGSMPAMPKSHQQKNKILTWQAELKNPGLTFRQKIDFFNQEFKLASNKKLFEEASINAYLKKFISIISFGRIKLLEPGEETYMKIRKIFRSQQKVLKQNNKLFNFYNKTN